MRLNFHEMAARRKLGELPAEFAFARWEVVGPDAVVMEGGVARPITRGPRKGQQTWDKLTHKVAVTKAEAKAEFTRYEAETGKCGICAGSGLQWIGWSRAEGDKFRECRRCGGTGKAPEA